jgi:CheY-like chemotaxis protein
MSGARVLLVDDELSSTEVLALILAGEGYQVTVAADGRQAWPGWTRRRRPTCWSRTS